MYRVEIERQIEIAHQLPDTKWLLTKACTRKHGHSYHIKVELGFWNLTPNKMACDFAVIKEVIDKYDHQDLNGFFKPTTAENFSDILIGEIKKALKKYGNEADTIRVGLSETGKSWIWNTWESLPF